MHSFLHLVTCLILVLLNFALPFETTSVQNGEDHFQGSVFLNFTSAERETGTSSKKENKHLPRLLYLYCVTGKGKRDGQGGLETMTRCSDFNRKKIYNDFPSGDLIDYGRLLITEESDWQNKFVVGAYEMKTINGSIQDRDRPPNFVYVRPHTYFVLLYCSQVPQIRSQEVNLTLRCYDVQNGKNEPLKLNNSSEKEGSSPDAECCVLDFTKIYSNSLIFSTLCLVAVVLNITFIFSWMSPDEDVGTAVQDWALIKQQTRKRLENALRKEKELEERQEQKRQQLQMEREERANGILSRLISSLFRPFLEEVRDFNEWVETPD